MARRTICDRSMLEYDDDCGRITIDVDEGLFHVDGSGILLTSNQARFVADWLMERAKEQDGNNILDSLH